MKALRITAMLGVAFFVGVLSQHLSGANAKPAAPEIVRAQSFALTDRQGRTVGLFAVDKSSSAGNPAIVLYNSRGETIWRAGNGPQPIATTQ